MQPFCLSRSPKCWETRGVNGQPYSCQDFSMFTLQASPPFDICKGYHHPRSPTLNPASQEKEKALGWKPTNPFVWLVTIPSPALGQILFFKAFPYTPRLWGHSPVCCGSGNMTGLAGVVCMAGMEWEGEVSCVKENLVHSRQRKPFAHGCTVHHDQQTLISSGRYGAALMLCFTSLVSVVTRDTQHLIPSCPWLSPQFFLLDKAFPSHPTLGSTPVFSFITSPLYQKALCSHSPVS